MPPATCSAFKASGAACTKRAYFQVDGSGLLCGQHSRKYLSRRVPLPKVRPPPFDLDAHYDRVVQLSKGEVRLQRMQMMKAVEQHPLFLCIFPNFKHDHRRDGYGFSALSPMKLGPVHHGQPGFPPAMNLENFWQGSKRFPSESEEEFHQNKIAWFTNPVPMRHKCKGVKPLYWSWVDAEGVEHRLDYIPSRKFYCWFYEKLAMQTTEWRVVSHDLAHLNRMICGYDGWPIEPTKEAIHAAYNDPTHPFGHERVLFAMLVLKRKEDYPWR
jgi:hypothetical protein